jgi:TPR repeat protein
VATDKSAEDKSPDEEPATAASDSPPAPSPKPKATASTPKPHAGIASATLADQVTEAQKYIYGRGVTQDCESGMRLLKPAAAQANPRAMIEMGALYSAGLCTPHDLPTAYRWFAMALRKDPDNQSWQADLQKIWGEMTQPERQLAIKLSH